LQVVPYILDSDLSAVDRFNRLEQFVDEMDKLQIPNPYNVVDWVGAERRWENLGRDSGWSVKDNMMALNC